MDWTFSVIETLDKGGLLSLNLWKWIVSRNAVFQDKFNQTHLTERNIFTFIKVFIKSV